MASVAVYKTMAWLLQLWVLVSVVMKHTTVDLGNKTESIGTCSTVASMP